MSSDLYEILNVSREASQEEIRRAYKRRALLTHPDRALSPDATPAEKAAVEEQFRKVNNAYEILKDSTKRQAYDLHGIWPPPTQEARPSASHYNDHSRYQRRRYHSRPTYFFQDPADFHFTDPFVFFDSIFNDDGHNSRHGFHQPRAMHSNMDSMMSNLFASTIALSSMGMGMGMRIGMGQGMTDPPVMNSRRRTYSTSMNMGSSSGGNGRWASQSTMSQTINGVTQTVKKCRDWDGNEFVTRIYPDGRRIVTVNGVVSESDQGNIPPPHRDNYLTSGSPPPSYSSRNYDEPERPVIPITSNFPTVNYNNEDMRAHSRPSRKRWWGRAT